MMCSVTLLSSGAGGAGKSTVTAALGCALALRGKHTVILDCNPLWAGPARLLGCDSTSPYHLGDAAAGDCHLWDAVFPSGIPGLDLTLPPPAARDLPEENTLLSWLALLTKRYDQVLIDTPFWTDCFLTAAPLADTTLLLTEANRRSTACCDRLRTALQGQAIRNPRLVINRFHRQRFLQQEEFDDLDQVIDSCGIRLLAVIPEDGTLACDLPLSIQQTLDYDNQKFTQKAKGGAIAIHCLADRLLGQLVPLRNLDKLQSRHLAF